MGNYMTIVHHRAPCGDNKSITTAERVEKLKKNLIQEGYTIKDVRESTSEEVSEMLEIINRPEPVKYNAHKRDNDFNRGRK